jgi:uncharacterized membrane protein
MQEEKSTTFKQHRLVFIDVLRGIAILWMIETHVIDACLNTSLKTGFFYNMLNISNGFIAVTFLFCAGAGFWLAAQKKAEDYKKFKPPLWVYLRRLGVVMVMGYWLHMPLFSLLRSLKMTSEQYLRFCECDVLQAIVFSSILALIILMLTPKLKYLPYIFGILTLIFFFFAPIIWTLDPFQALPTCLATYFSKPPISKFPIFPWSGYFFAGAAISGFFFSVENKRKFAAIIGIIALILPFIMFAFKYSSLTYPGFVDWWRVSPGHSIYRVSVSILFFALLFLIEDKYKNTRVSNMLRISGQESLFMYVSHLMIVYGCILNLGLNHIIGYQLDWFRSSLLIIAICCTCYAFAFAWHNAKAKEPKLARFLMIAVSVLFIAVFILNP